MRADADGVLDQPVADSAFAILDFETTGLSPGIDRVVELAVLRKEAGRPAERVFDTLVNPQRPVAATEIHGITDEDVRDAPLFEEVAPDLLRALSGCVVAAYNAYFDIRFLEFELGRLNRWEPPPYVCLMYLRPLLGLGPRCGLGEACRAHSIEHTVVHAAIVDVKASAKLLDLYLEAVVQRRVLTFRDLLHLKQYKFLDSLSRKPLSQAAAAGFVPSKPFKPRGPEAVGEMGQRIETAKRIQALRLAMGAYWDALTAAIVDLDVTETELISLQLLKRLHELADEQVRVLHARAFTSAITRYTDDEWLDDEEREKLRRLYACLDRLGWAPGS